MNRKEYMERLEQLLLVLSNEEREEALQYYQGYFEDAGIENEENVIRELGTPEEVAAKIRAGFAGENGEYSEQGFEDIRFQNNQEIMADYKGENSEWKDSFNEAERVEEIWEEMPGEKDKIYKNNEKNKNIWKVIAIVVLILFAAPIMLPLGIVLLVVFFALIVAVAAILFGLGVSGFAILFSGIIIIVSGISKIILAPGAGILAAGIGCILSAIGILISWVIISVLVKIVPGMIRGIVNFLGTPFRKAGAR